MLNVLDRKILRLITGAHRKTPSEMLYLETGALKISHVIAVRRLMYLRNILERHDDEVVKKVYIAQKKNPSKGDWVTTVTEDLEKYDLNLNDVDIIKLTEIDYKNKVKKNVREKAFEEFITILNGHDKVKQIQYENMNKPQEYFGSKMLNNKQRSLLMNLRCKTVRGVRNNFHTFYKSEIFCPFKCKSEKDSQEHMLQCHGILSYLTIGQQEELSTVKYSDLFGSIQQQSKITQVFQFLLKIRYRLLENSQQPAYHGNSSGPID